MSTKTVIFWSMLHKKAMFFIVKQHLVGKAPLILGAFFMTHKGLTTCCNIRNDDPQYMTKWPYVKTEHLWMTPA